VDVNDDAPGCAGPTGPERPDPGGEHRRVTATIGMVLADETAEGCALLSAQPCRYLVSVHGLGVTGAEDGPGSGSESDPPGAARTAPAEVTELEVTELEGTGGPVNPAGSEGIAATGWGAGSGSGSGSGSSSPSSSASSGGISTSSIMTSI